MASAKDTAFAAVAQTGFEGKEAPTHGTKVTADAAMSLRSSKSYKLVKSETGNNLYVEVRNVSFAPGHQSEYTDCVTHSW